MEEAILHTIETISTELSWLNYFLIILFAALESFPIFGALIPGQLIIIFYGAASKLGTLDPLLCIFVAIIGALIGDIGAYFLGRHKGSSFIKVNQRKFGLSEVNVESAKNLVRNHPAKTLILGRLNSLSRSISPFAAGISHLPFPKFIFIVSAGSILWAILSIGIGFIFGSSFEIAANAFGKFIVMATLSGAVIAAVFMFIRKRKYEIGTVDIVYGAISVFSLFIFAHFAENVRNFSQVSVSDIKIAESVFAIADTKLTYFMIWVSTISDRAYIVIFSFFLITFLALRKHVREAWVILTSIVGGIFLISTLKGFFGRVRPPSSILLEETASFPSGHAMFATILCFSIIHLTIYHIKRKWLKISIITFTSFFAVMISFSRIYLGVHWLSDIVAGIAIGLWLTTIIHICFKFFPWLYKISKKEHIIEKL